MFSRKFSNNITKRKRLLLSLIILIALTLGLGYSAFSSDFSIGGQLGVSKIEVKAENLSYDNTNSGVTCSDAQCMIDYLAGITG